MIEEINTQKPEFMVQDGAIRLMKVKATSVGKEAFFTDHDTPALKTFLKSHKNALVEDFPQEEYQGVEGLTGEMLEYLPDEEVLDFDHCSQERLAMVIQKRCMRRGRSAVLPVDPLYEEFLRDERLAEFRKVCQKAIDEGVEVVTSEGIKRFSLTLPDQINLMGLRSLLDRGVSAMPYHADGESVRLWTNDDIRKIVQEADQHIAYHRAYYSLLREWMRRTSYPEFLGIDYGDALPDDLARSMTEICDSYQSVDYCDFSSDSASE